MYRPHGTFLSSQSSASEYQVSSATAPGVDMFLLQITEAVEEVMTTLLTDVDLVHDLRTFNVPLTAGSTSSSLKMEKENILLVCN